jgi:hypothetical protein
MPNYPFLCVLCHANDLNLIISLDKEFSPCNEEHFVETSFEKIGNENYSLVGQGYFLDVLYFLKQKQLSLRKSGHY